MTDGKTTVENILGKHFEILDILFGTLVAWIPITAKDKSPDHEFDKNILKGIFSSFVSHAEGRWPGDSLVAGYEYLQRSEPSEIYVKKFKRQQVFVKSESEFPCANGTLVLPQRPRPALEAEGDFSREDDADLEEGDKKKCTTEHSRSMSWVFFYDTTNNIVWSCTQMMKHYRSLCNTLTWWHKLRRVYIMSDASSSTWQSVQ